MDMFRSTQFLTMYRVFGGIKPVKVTNIVLVLTYMYLSIILFNHIFGG